MLYDENEAFGSHPDASKDILDQDGLLLSKACNNISKGTNLGHEMTPVREAILNTHGKVKGEERREKRGQDSR